METVFNLTRHKATKDQKAVGIIDLPYEYITRINTLSTFEPIPTSTHLIERANEIVAVLQEYIRISGMYEVDSVMLGGAPYFNAVLDKVLTINGFVPCYPFTLKQSQHNIENNKTVSTTVYKHMGLVHTS
jgi:hypothetical protein